MKPAVDSEAPLSTLSSVALIAADSVACTVMLPSAAVSAVSRM